MDLRSEMSRLTHKFVGILSSHQNKGKRLFTARFPFIAGQLVKDSPAEKAGTPEG